MLKIATITCTDGEYTWGRIHGWCGYNDVQWSLVDGTLTITGEGVVFDYYYYWDQSEQHYTPAWYAYTDRITDVVIEEGITYIGDYAFYNCTELKSVTFPSTLDTNTGFGNNVFRGCTSLEEITFPDGLTVVPQSCFYGCTALKTVNLPDSLLGIAANAFYNCTSLQSIDIPDSVWYIADYAFENCTSLTDITLPAGLLSLEEGVFAGCTGLTYVDVPDKVTTINDAAFKNCTGLRYIYIPSTVTKITGQPFFGCSLDLTPCTDAAALPTTWEEGWNWPGESAASGMFAYKLGVSRDDMYWVMMDPDATVE